MLATAFQGYCEDKMLTEHKQVTSTLISMGIELEGEKIGHDLGWTEWN